jgi:signal transduction histidine kinase
LKSAPTAPGRRRGRNSSELQRSLTAQARLVAEVTHDLGGLLAAIRLSTAAVPDPGAQQTIVRAVEQIDSLRDLLQAALLAEGELPLMRRTVEAADLFDMAVSAARPLAEAHQITIMCRSAPRLRLRVDTARMLRVLGNLVSNALRHGPPGSQVYLRAQARRDGVLLSVRDHGPGIDAAEQPHVFERHARRRDEDHGLGLYVARQIVLAHGGRIWFDGTRGEGTTFYVALPAEGAWAHSEGAVRRSKRSGSAPDGTYARARSAHR